MAVYRLKSTKLLQIVSSERFAAILVYKAFELLLHLTGGQLRVTKIRFNNLERESIHLFTFNSFY